LKGSVRSGRTTRKKPCGTSTKTWSKLEAIKIKYGRKNMRERKNDKRGRTD